MKSRKDSHLTEKTKVLPTRTSQSPDLSPSSLIISLSTLPCVLIQLHRGFITLSWGQRGNSACSRIYTQKNTSRFKLFITVHPNPPTATAITQAHTETPSKPTFFWLVGFRKPAEGCVYTFCAVCIYQTCIQLIMGTTDASLINHWGVTGGCLVTGADYFTIKALVSEENCEG